MLRTKPVIPVYFLIFLSLVFQNNKTYQFYSVVLSSFVIWYAANEDVYYYKFMYIHSKNLFVFSIRRLKIFSSQIVVLRKSGNWCLSPYGWTLIWTFITFCQRNFGFYKWNIENLKTCPCLKIFLTVSSFWVQHLLFATTFYNYIQRLCRFEVTWITDVHLQIVAIIILIICMKRVFHIFV